MGKIITAINLRKTYKTYEREQGFWNAIKSLIRRKYVYKKAVKGISFHVDEGEILGYIGPNGSGKSTTIKILTGILTPDSGHAKVMGFIPWKQRRKYVKNIGVVFGQKSQLWWDLPPSETFLLIKDIYEIPDKIFKQRVEYFTKLLDIKEISKTQVRNLSLGERMRCEIIAALLHNPKVVFLDEPTIGLDVVAKDRIRKFIKKINEEEKTTFILTTHDMDDVEELCKRVIIIDKGAKIYDGPLSNVRKKYVKYRIIKLTFSYPIEKIKFKIKNARIVKKTKHELELKITTKHHIGSVITPVLRKYDVRDIVIMEPKIEDVIRWLYRERIKELDKSGRWKG